MNMKNILFSLLMVVGLTNSIATAEDLNQKKWIQEDRDLVMTGIIIGALLGPIVGPVGPFVGGFVGAATTIAIKNLNQINAQTDNNEPTDNIDSKKTVIFQLKQTNS